MSATFIQIEPTTRCNFTCGFCCGRYMPQEDMEWEVFERTVDAFEDLEHVELQGEGESLMHPRFFDMVELLRARDIKVSFISNGSLLNPPAVDRLLRAGVDKISVSIESPDAETFREIRGGKLEKVQRNLAHLMEQRRLRGLDRPVVGFSITVLERTRHQLPAILDLYRSLGLDGGITMQPLQRMEAYAQHYGEQMREEFLDDEAVEKLWLAFFANHEVRAIQDDRGGVLGFYDELMEGWRPAKKTCPYLERGLYVHRNGAVSACCMIKDTDRHGFGQVGTDSAEEILERRAQMRSVLAAGELPVPCEGCELARFALMRKGELMRFGVKGLWNRWFAPKASESQTLVRIRKNPG